MVKHLSCEVAAEFLSEKQLALSYVLYSLFVISVDLFFQVIKDLRFCHIEKTDHVPSARATRLILPLFSQCNTNVSLHSDYQRE